MNNSDEFGSSASASPHVRWVRLWRGEDQEICVTNCERLRKAEIGFRVIQGHAQYFKGTDDEYEIRVPADLHALAKETIADKFFVGKNPEFIARFATSASSEERPTSHATAIDNIHSTALTQRLVIVESKSVSSIEMSLRENDIQFRSEDVREDKRNLYVSMQDLTKAREIVREVENEMPND
jgi:hypothetical protein